MGCMQELKGFNWATARLKSRIVPAALAGLTLAILVTLLLYLKIDALYGFGTSAIIFTSFASSIFIMFITPNSRAAKNVKFVKSYMLAAIVGYFGDLLLISLPLAIVAGLVIFILIVLMILTQSEHPPAAAIAFAFVLFRVGIVGLIVIFSGVAIIIAIRFLLETAIFEAERKIRRLDERKPRTKKHMT